RLVSPSRPRGRTQADRAHLVEADDGAVAGLLLAQLEDPRRLLLVVGVGARLPAAGALKRQPGLGQQRAEMARRDGDPVAAEMDRRPRQGPACGRDPRAVGTGTGHADDPLTLLSRDPAGTPAPVARAETVHPPLVEVMDDLPHPGRIGTPHLRDLRH